MLVRVSENYYPHWIVVSLCLLILFKWLEIALSAKHVLRFWWWERASWRGVFLEDHQLQVSRRALLPFVMQAGAQRIPGKARPIMTACDKCVTLLWCCIPVTMGLSSARLFIKQRCFSQRHPQARFPKPLQSTSTIQ